MAFLGFLNYNHVNANNNFRFLFCCENLEHVRVWGNSGWLPRKEITNYEVIISNHSFNGCHNAIILKFWL
ncbi:hypothetical protein FIM43_07265 [Helicobacter pylori]|nr:hypothetical protein FIM43_07265 [Helicobacter pylori]